MKQFKVAEKKYATTLDTTISVLRKQIEDQIQIIDSIVKNGSKNNPLFVIHRLSAVLTALNQASVSKP